MAQVNNKENITLSGAEKRLILIIRELEWGNLELLVQNSKPVLVKQMMKTIKLIDTRQYEDN
jgi:hypothetical protein